MAPLIEIRDLTKVYGRQKAVDGLNLSIEEGEIFGFLGPNGAGKTTTLLMLLGLTEPTSGQARVLGLDPLREPLKVKRYVGYLPENVGFYGELTAREGLRYVANLNWIKGSEAESKIEYVLSTVGLTEQADKLISTFSRGMRQRLGIAEMLIKDPKLVFLDEPTLGLDPDGIKRMLDLIVSMSREKGISVVLCSHLLHQVQKICHRFGIMMQGRLVAQGTIHDMVVQTPEAGETSMSLEEVYMHYFQGAKDVDYIP